MMPDSFNHRATDKASEKIRDMIEKEPSEIERKRLQLMQYLLDQAAAQTRYVLELEKSQNTKFNQYQEELDNHKTDVFKQLEDHDKILKQHSDLVIQGQTTWKHIVAVAVILGGGFAAAYKVVDNLQVTVSGLTQSVRSLEDRANLFNETAERDNFAKAIRKQLTAIEIAANSNKLELEDLHNQIQLMQLTNTRIISKKAFKAMR
jgi:hypothetical protein